MISYIECYHVSAKRRGDAPPTSGSWELRQLRHAPRKGSNPPSTASEYDLFKFSSDVCMNDAKSDVG